MTACIAYRKEIVQKATTALHDPEFVSRHRANAKDFTLERKLTFSNLVLFLLNMVKGAVGNELAPLAVDERTLAARHLENSREQDLIIYDRGYPAFHLFALHRHLGRDFCARSSWNLYNETRDFWLSGKAKQRVALKPSTEAKKPCQQAGLSIEPIEVRWICPVASRKS